MRRALLLAASSFALWLPACGSGPSSSVFDESAGDGGADTASGGDETATTDSGAADSTGTDTATPEDTGGPSIDTGAEPIDTGKPSTDTGSAPDTMIGPTDTGPAVDASGCTEPYAKVWPTNGHCYFPINTRSWTVARDFCVSQGAHLATITSDGEQAFVASFVGMTDRWIGLARSTTGTPTADAYKWVTGEAMTYKDWSAGEPNFSGACVRMRSDGTWADYDCTQNLYGVCERE